MPKNLILFAGVMDLLSQTMFILSDVSMYYSLQHPVYLHIVLPHHFY